MMWEQIQQYSNCIQRAACRSMGICRLGNLQTFSFRKKNCCPPAFSAGSPCFKVRHLAQRCWISSSSLPWHCNQIQFVMKFWLKSDWGPKGRGKFTQYQRWKYLRENPYRNFLAEIFPVVFFSKDFSHRNISVEIFPVWIFPQRFSRRNISVEILP